jgi:hypothetical protein
MMITISVPRAKPQNKWTRSPLLAVVRTVLDDADQSDFEELDDEEDGVVDDDEDVQYE